MLQSGHVTDAAVALSRPYRLFGRIIPGKGRGRQLGFPTLNLQTPLQIIPASGVYAGFVELADSQEGLFEKTQQISAVFSIGQTITYGSDNPLLIEAHLLIDNADMLKDTWMAMDFIECIRDQQKFKSDADLAKQIKNDCQNAENILNNFKK